MAFTGLLALIDDIAGVLDDVAAMVKISARKTSGLVTDDLVVTAEQVAAITTKREVPIVLKVAKGSLINKAVLIPAALLLNLFVPFVLGPLLLAGAAYLCYEATEKILHYFVSRKTKKILEKVASEEKSADGIVMQDAKGTEVKVDIEAHDALMVENVEADLEARLIKQQKSKIKAAIRTDFILSAEIIVIALNIVAASSMTIQIATLVAIGLLMTLVVYGSVIALVKLDDLGLFFMRKARDASSIIYKLGQGLFILSKRMMGTLSFIGTTAMLLVGGEILLHKLTAVELGLYDVIERIAEKGEFLGDMAHMFVPSLFNILLGIIYGCVVILGVRSLQKIGVLKVAAD